MSSLLLGRDGRKFLDDAVYLGLGYAQDAGNLADGLTLALELSDVLSLDLAGLVGTVTQVLRLNTKFYELEVNVATFVGDLVDQDVIAAVFLFTGTDFQLLDVTQAFILGGLANGHHTVEVVEQALGTCQIVLRDGAGEGAFGRMRDNQQ